MSADLLREAAALMRQRAKSARTGDGKWTVETSCYCELYGDDVECSHNPVTWALRVPGGPAPVLSFEAGELHRASFAEHIASWHPDVALAVADWLDLIAAELESDEISDLPTASEANAAHKVACTYLGRES